MNVRSGRVPLPAFSEKKLDLGIKLFSIVFV